MANEQTPKEKYDSVHGSPDGVPDCKPMSPDQEWGESLNPVRETPLAGTGLREVK